APYTSAIYPLSLHDALPISIDTAHDPRIVQASDNSLTITTTKELDSGIYTCIAVTELDSVNASATLTVQDVPNAPRIVGVDCDRDRKSTRLNSSHVSISYAV